MSFAHPKTSTNKPEIPLAAMVDVLFLLLIFFMTTSVFREYDQQINVSLPPTDSGETKQSPTKIVITITQDSQIYIGDRLYSLDDLRRTLVQLATQFPDEPVIIRGDRGSRLDTAVKVMDIAYSAQLQNVYIATSKPADEI